MSSMICALPWKPVWLCFESICISSKTKRAMLKMLKFFFLFGMPYMYASYVCLMCMPYMYALYVCLICMPGLIIISIGAYIYSIRAYYYSIRAYIYALYACLMAGEESVTGLGLGPASGFTNTRVCTTASGRVGTFFSKQIHKYFFNSSTFS